MTREPDARDRSRFIEHAVQIGTALGAEVTGVCSTANAAMVRSLGADHVCDYTKADFTTARSRYDLILDNVGNRSLSDVRGALKPRGTLVLNSGTGASGMRMTVRLIRPVLLSRFVRQQLRRYLSNPNRADLEVLKALVEAEHQDLRTRTGWFGAGELTPVIDRTYRLSAAADALRYVGAGHTRGKVVRHHRLNVGSGVTTHHSATRAPATAVLRTGSPIERRSTT